MVTSGTQPFPTDALDANRAGQLTAAQRDRLRPIARYNRQSALVAAVILAVGAAMMLFDRDFSLADPLRQAAAGVLAILAVIFLGRALVGADGLSRDLRQRKVQCADGAIGKRSRSSSGRGSRRTYWLEVGDGLYRVSLAGYQAAPDAAMVRVYFLPHSRRVVNLERLADPPLDADLTPQKVLATLGAALLSGNHRAANELRAQMAPVADAATAARQEAVTPPPLDARDPRPLEQAIVGTWASPIMTVAFGTDGTVTATLIGGIQRHGRWSVDRAGRLIADVTGRQGSTDAWVVGNELTICADNDALRFTRRE